MYKTSGGCCFGWVGSGFRCNRVLSLLLSFGELLEILDREVRLQKAGREFGRDNVRSLQWDL